MAHRLVTVWLAVVICVGVHTISIGQTAEDVNLTDREIELIARDIGASLRCVVCQNQSIEESDASLAEDMRTLVRARVRQGENKEEFVQKAKAFLTKNSEYDSK